MSTTEHADLVSELRDHERQARELASELRDLGARTDAEPKILDHEAVFMSAHILRHRISMALIASRLGMRGKIAP